MAGLTRRAMSVAVDQPDSLEAFEQARDGGWRKVATALDASIDAILRSAAIGGAVRQARGARGAGELQALGDRAGEEVALPVR